MAEPHTIDELVARLARQRFVTLQFHHVAEMEPEALMNMDDYPGVIFCGTKVWESLRESIPSAEANKLEVPTVMWPWVTRTAQDCDIVRKVDSNMYETRGYSEEFQASLKRWDELTRTACAYDCGACSADAQGEVTSTPHKQAP